MGNPSSIPIAAYSIAGRSQGGYPQINPNNNWRIAAPFRLQRVDTLQQLSHYQESGAAAYWRWASTKHSNEKRVAWRGGEPPFRFTIYKNGVQESETTWVRTQSLVDPLMYDHTYPEFGYEHNFQPSSGENGTTINYTYLIESQDGQALLIYAPTQVDNSRFRYFDAANGNNANAGTFEAPFQTFGYGYSSVANSQNYIYCYKSGTYLVNNGTTMNDAAFNSTHCKSHVGIESGVIMDMSTGNFSKGTSDIYVANFSTTGGRSDKANVRQFDLDIRSDRFHAHKITGAVTFIGTIGNDNPAVFMLWDIEPRLQYHTGVAFTDCTLASNSLAQFATLFKCKDVLNENFRSLSPNTTAPNGGQHFHLKDGCLNVTIRHSEFSGQSTDGMLNVSSGDWAACGNVDVHFCKIVNLKSGAATCSKWNSAVNFAGSQLPTNYFVQRCDVAAYQTSPFTFEGNGRGGEPVNYTAIRWSSTSSVFDNGSAAQEAGAPFGTSTVKVSDINNYSSSDLGVRGCVISSTLVV